MAFGERFILHMRDGPPEDRQGGHTTHITHVPVVRTKLPGETCDAGVRLPYQTARFERPRIESRWET
jgi:hypothetical protein